MDKRWCLNYKNGVFDDAMVLRQWGPEVLESFQACVGVENEAAELAITSGDVVLAIEDRMADGAEEDDRDSLSYSCCLQVQPRGSLRLFLRCC